MTDHHQQCARNASEGVQDTDDDHITGGKGTLTLGSRGCLPGGHIEVTLRFLKQFVHTLPRGYMLDSFAMYPPL